jgi:hypothetical protein
MAMTKKEPATIYQPQNIFSLFILIKNSHKKISLNKGFVKISEARRANLYNGAQPACARYTLHMRSPVHNLKVTRAGDFLHGHQVHPLPLIQFVLQIIYNAGKKSQKK